MPAAKPPQQPELIERPGGLVRFDSLLLQAAQSNASIDTIERLVALVKDREEWEAKRAWLKALAKFQQDCPTIPKLRVADLERFSYKYSPLDKMLKITKPVMAPLGLTPRWRAIPADPRFVGTECILAHDGGHEESSGPVTMPIPEANRGANAAQRSAGAMTYAQRRAFILVSGVVPEDEDSDTNEGDDDDNPEGPPGKNPEGPDVERPALIHDIMRTIDRYQFTTDERLAIGRDYLPSGRLNAANVEQLRKLEGFLNDAEAVKQWREQREHGA